MAFTKFLNGPSRLAVAAGFGLVLTMQPAFAEPVSEADAAIIKVAAEDDDLLQIENDPRANLEVDSEADLVVKRFSKKQNQQEFTSAVRNAVLTHPRFGTFRARVDASEASYREARSNYYPSMTIGVTGRASEFGAGGQDLDGRVRTGGYAQDVEALATLSQTIYDGGETAWQVDRQRALTVAESAQMKADASDLALDAVDAWYGYLREAMRYQLAQRSFEAHQKILARVKLRYEGGAASVTDLSRSEARLADARATMVTREASLNIATERYREMFGAEPAADVGMVAVESLVPDALGDAVAVALDESPLIDRASAERTAAEAAVGMAHAEHMPSLSLEMNAIRFDLFSDQARNGATARLVARYSFYLGGGRIARNDRAKADLARASYQEAAIKRALDRDVRIAWERMRALGMRLVMLERALRANEEARELIREQFKFEGRTLFDLLEAERDVFSAADRYVSGMIDFEMSRYEMAGQVGTLPELLQLFGAAAQTAEELPARRIYSNDGMTYKPVGSQSPAEYRDKEEPLPTEEEKSVEEKPMPVLFEKQLTEDEPHYEDQTKAEEPAPEQAADFSIDAIKGLFKPKAENQQSQTETQDRMGAIEPQDEGTAPVALAGLSEDLNEDQSEQ